MPHAQSSPAVTGHPSGSNATSGRSLTLLANGLWELRYKNYVTYHEFLTDAILWELHNWTWEG